MNKLIIWAEITIWRLIKFHKKTFSLSNIISKIKMQYARWKSLDSNNNNVMTSFSVSLETFFYRQVVEAKQY